MILSRCAALGQIKLAAAAYPAWTRAELETVIAGNARVVLEIAYPVLLDAQRDAWAVDIALTIEDILRLLSRANSFVFQELCWRRASPPAQDWVRDWAGIARAASKSDSGVNLPRKLAEIQKSFTHESTQYRHLLHRASARAIKAGILPVTSDRPLGVRADLRALIRRPNL
jgi:hypothetical protein